MTISPPPPPTLPEQAALLKLLADEDAAVHRAVRERILAGGPEAARWLHPHRLSGDGVVRRRVREILRHFAAREADREFLLFCLRHQDDCDLETGALLLARTAHPELNAEAYRAVLDQWAADSRERWAGAGAPREVLGRWHAWLFGPEGFHGDRETYFRPGNNYLNEVLDRRAGNPIGLSLVYLLLAKRLGLPMAGIGFPGHFLCRYQDAAESIYIDVFDGGRLLSKADCVNHLLRSGLGFQEPFLAPVSGRLILQRLCANLHQSYAHLGEGENALRVRGYLMALTRGAAE